MNSFSTLSLTLLVTLMATTFIQCEVVEQKNIVNSIDHDHKTVVILDSKVVSPIHSKVVAPIHSRLGFIPSALGSAALIKKGLIAAKVVSPFAIGAKVAVGTAMAVPSVIGGIIGIPIGAVVGAKAGLIKGAAVGAGLGLHALTVGTALAAKPLIIGAGVKTALAAHGAAMVAQGVSALGLGVSAGGRFLAEKGNQISYASEKINSYQSIVKDKVADYISHAQTYIPTMEKMPTIMKFDGPKHLDVTYSLKHPLVGHRFGKALVTQNAARRRRSLLVPSMSQPDMKKVNTKQLIETFKSPTAQTCLCRVICELSANPNMFGQEGFKFGASLLSLSRIKFPGMSKFRTAASSGVRSKNPSSCIVPYETCKTPSKEIIKVGNSLING